MSDNFLKHIAGRELKKNEWTPCPRCGEGKVTPPTSAATGAFGCGFLGIGSAVIGIFLTMVATIVTAIFLGPLAIIVAAGGLIAIVLMPIIGAGIGAGTAMLYTCKSCGFIWTYKDTEMYKASATGLN